MLFVKFGWNQLKHLNPNKEKKGVDLQLNELEYQ